MIPETHPILKALRQFCNGDLTRYEAMIASMQEAFFVDSRLRSDRRNQESIDQFLQELFEERERYYSRQETARILSKHHPELAERLFKSNPKRKPPKKS